MFDYFIQKQSFYLFYSSLYCLYDKSHKLVISYDLQKSLLLRSHNLLKMTF